MVASLSSFFSNPIVFNSTVAAGSALALSAGAKLLGGRSFPNAALIAVPAIAAVAVASLTAFGFACTFVATTAICGAVISAATCDARDKSTIALVTIAGGLIGAGVGYLIVLLGSIKLNGTIAYTFVNGQVYPTYIPR